MAQSVRLLYIETIFRTGRRQVEQLSSGAAVRVALDLAREMDSGTIVTLLPDRGDRYVTTVLYCNERCRTAECRVEHCRECPGHAASL